ncbi:MAG: zinc finger Ran-binding domain-containing protein [Candidatus Xenobium sp.]|nr:hypothetical protein [Burkholderiales bacterium]
MNSTWICSQCQTANPLADHRCSSCGAEAPPAVPTPGGLDDSFAEVLASTLASTASSPPRSDMLAGLESLVGQVDSGDMSPEAFAEKMRTASQALDEVFAAMAAEIFEVAEADEADEAYVQAIETGMETSRALFKMALAELESYAEHPDPGHLRVGMLVAEKAEEHYQGLLESVQMEAVGHRFSGSPDLVRRLAGAVLEGVLSLEDYQEQLGQLQEALEAWLAEGTRLLRSGLAKARDFDGRADEGVARAGQELESASRELGRVILAIHDPESTREAARQILHEEATAKGLD